MLVLTRKRTEKIQIGEDIVITVIHTSSGSVKLGIQAPSNVRVLRAELNDRGVGMEVTGNISDSISVKVTKEQGSVNEMPSTMPLPADRFLGQFGANDIAEMEDQVLMCLAK